MSKYGITVLSARSKKAHFGPHDFLSHVVLGASWSFKRQNDGRFALAVFQNKSHLVTVYTDGEIYMGNGAIPSLEEVVEENLDSFLEWAKNWRAKNKWAETWKPKA